MNGSRAMRAEVQLDLTQAFVFGPDGERVAAPGRAATA